MPKQKSVKTEPEAAASGSAVVAEAPVKTKSKFDIKAFLKTKKGKIVAGIVAGVAVIGLLFAAPVTRYGILGTVVKKDVTITVLDSLNSRPITEASVALAGQSATTDADGKVKFSGVPVGDYHAQITKAYFIDLSQSVRVAVFSDAAHTLKIVATGRQVPVTVLNKITGKPVENAYVGAGELTAKTDEEGKAILVVPVDQTAVQAIVKTAGFNDLSVEVTVTEQEDDKNKFSVVPNGKVYFLSKRTGKIDVMKSNLDGTDAQVVLAGTGKENDGEIALLASRDWKHLALKAKRDSDKPKLYYINALNDQTSLIDEGDAEFTLVGWSGDHFVYSVSRNTVPPENSNKYVLKGYHGPTAKLTTLDQNTAEIISHGQYRYQRLTNVYIVGDKVFYIKEWDASYNHLLSGKTNNMYTIKPDGQDKKEMSAKPGASNISYMQARAYRPDELYIAASPMNYQDKTTYFEYEDGDVKEDKEMTGEKFGQTYPIQLVSPSGERTLWHDARDGKNVIFVGNGAGEDGKEIARLEGQASYGWYSDEYVLLAKDRSELYIMSRDGGEPVKVTDYHRVPFVGYGYGYGGATDDYYY